MSTLDPRALPALKNNQRQLDMDGVEVGVSRQALDELLAYLSALPKLGLVAWFDRDRVKEIVAMEGRKNG